MSLGRHTTCAVLIPGSGLGSWIWGKVAPDLDQVVTIDYPAEAKASWRLADYADHVIGQIDASDAGRVTLVGHSIGTVVALEAAHRLGDRVDGLLSVSGVVPAANGSFFSAFPFPQRLIVSTIVRLSGTRPPEGMLRKGLCEGLDEATATEVISRFTPESQRLFRDSPHQPTTVFPRGYVHTTRDKEVPPALQARFGERLGAGFDATLASGHLPMLETPAELVTAIRDFLTTV